MLGRVFCQGMAGVPAESGSQWDLFVELKRTCLTNRSENLQIPWGLARRRELTCIRGGGMVQVSRMRVVAWESRVPSLELLLISLMRDVSSFYKEKVSGVIFTFLGSLSLNI